MSKFTNVSKDEFEAFIAANQPLQSEFSTICEPPTTRYYNQTGTIALFARDWMSPDGEIDKENHGRFWTYRIAKDTSKD